MEAALEEDDLAWAVLYRGDETWHAGPGWYYVDEEYPDEGSCGSFETAEEAIRHAEAADYRVRAWAC